MFEAKRSGLVSENLPCVDGDPTPDWHGDNLELFTYFKPLYDYVYAPEVLQT